MDQIETARKYYPDNLVVLYLHATHETETKKHIRAKSINDIEEKIMKEKNYSKEQWWNPTITVEVIILDIILLLQKPNQESILNIQAYNEFINDKEKYNTTLKRCVRRSIEYL